MGKSDQKTVIEIPGIVVALTLVETQSQSDTKIYKIWEWENIITFQIQFPIYAKKVLTK